MRTNGYVDLLRHREFRALWAGNAPGSTIALLALGSLVVSAALTPALLRARHDAATTPAL